MTRLPRWGVEGDPLLTLPKLSLHDHLDGSLSPETLIELAGEQGVTLPYTDPDLLAGWFQGRVAEPVIDDWDEMFGLLTAVMQDAASIHRVAREFVLELFADGVVYGEARWAPEKHVGRGLSLDEAVIAVAEGLDAGEREVEALGGSIRVRQILCGMRTGDRSVEIAELTVRHYGASVAGFDLAGEENGFPASRHLAAIAIIEAADIPFTIHCGELAGLDSMADTLRLCHPVRVGHGMRIIEDFTLDGRPLVARSALADIRDGRAAGGGEPVPGPLAIRMRDRGVPFELCLSSNSGGLIVETREDHPMGLLKSLGFTVTVNPDNRLLSATCVTRELRYAIDAFGWTANDLLDVARNAVQASFMSTDDRADLLAETIEPAYAAWAATEAVAGR